MAKPLFNVTLTLFMLMSVGSIWAADESEGENPGEISPERSGNMESWQEEWHSEEKKSDWTWFGMGYESRRSSSGSQNGGLSTGSVKGPNGNGAQGGGRRQ